MPSEDQPNLPPIDLNGQDVEEEDTDTDGDESDGSESGFDFHSSEDEFEDYMVAHYMREQDSEDLQRENADLQRQMEAVAADGEAVAVELEETRQAVKRKLQEREEWARIKRLRVAVELAYDAMGVAVPLVEGGVSAPSAEGGVALDSPGGWGATGGAQVTVAEVLTAMGDFEEAAAEARRCLDDLTIYQQHMDED